MEIPLMGRLVLLCDFSTKFLQRCFFQLHLLDFIQQCLVTDLQAPGRLTTVPMCRLQHLLDRATLRLPRRASTHLQQRQLGVVRYSVAGRSCRVMHHWRFMGRRMAGEMTCSCR